MPGVEAVSADDLVAIWRSKRGERLQNYRAKFTILDTGTLSREWIDAVLAGAPIHASAPTAWRTWVEKGVYEPLIAEPTIEYRTREEQQPAAGRDESLVRCIYGYFKDNPHGFEHCAARLAGLMDSNIKIETVTRPSVDGGRDAIGSYRVGPLADRIALDFASLRRRPSGDYRCRSSSNAAAERNSTEAQSAGSFPGQDQRIVSRSR